MISKYAFALVSATLPCLAMGQDSGSYECSMGDLQRRVVVLSEPGRSVPCEVQYFKDSEAPNEKQVLWHATNQEGFCESKAEEFVDELESWGWDCGRGTTSAPKHDSEPVQDVADELPVRDDTDDLKPAVPTE